MNQNKKKRLIKTITVFFVLESEKKMKNNRIEQKQREFIEGDRICNEYRAKNVFDRRKGLKTHSQVTKNKILFCHSPAKIATTFD